MACGSCVGAVAWTFEMMSYVNFFEGYKIPNESQEALGQRLYSAFLVAYAIEFLCLTSAKLMVLDRMSMFLALDGTGTAVTRSRWAAAGHFVMAVVVLGNAVGLAGSIAAAANYQEDGTSASAYSALSVQRICDASVLLLIVVAFVVVGVLSASRVSASLLGVDAASAAAATGRALRRRMLGTTAFVFVAFLLRSVFSTFHAVAFELRDVDAACPGIDKSTYCDASCYNVYTHIVGWMYYTPEFESIIVLISSPLTLLVALWGMTSNATLQVMKSSGQEGTVPLMINSSKREKATVQRTALLDWSKCFR
jgi:hypothetical protein